MATYYLDIIDSRFFVKALTVGIISTGDMGHAVGKQLINNRVNVITALNDRSNRTKKLAKEAKHITTTAKCLISGIMSMI